MFEVKEAKREASPVLAAFIGQSGSGKTFSALLFMRGIVGPKGKIVVIDTEGKRALIYADDPEIGGFHHIDFVAPYSSDRFREAVKAAIAWGADGIIIDSASHEHEAEGGMLDYADQEAARMPNNKRGNAKWIKPKMAHGRFITAVKSAPVHVIFCIREKIIIDVDARPAKEVFLPVCDRDLPFEMALTIRLEPGTHKATFIKVPKPFQAHVHDGQVVTVDHGRLLMEEAGRGEKIDVSSREAISRLERAADRGVSELEATYKAEWREAGPASSADDLRKVTTGRSEMRKHLERLKRIAADADEARKSQPRSDDFPGDTVREEAPDSIGIVPSVAPNFDSLEQGQAEGNLFNEPTQDPDNF